MTTVAKVGKPGVLSRPPMGLEGPEYLDCLLLLSQVSQQGCGLEAKQPECKLVSMWAAVIA